MSLKTLERRASRGNLWRKTNSRYQKIIEILHKQVNHPFRRAAEGSGGLANGDEWIEKNAKAVVHIFYFSD